MVEGLVVGSLLDADGDVLRLAVAGGRLDDGRREASLADRLAGHLGVDVDEVEYSRTRPPVNSTPRSRPRPTMPPIETTPTSHGHSDPGAAAPHQVGALLVQPSPHAAACRRGR